MMTKIKINALLSLTLLSNVSKSEVDIKDGSYFKTWTDFEIPTHTYTFQLRRHYDSRSLHHGIFGYGWCSDFEKTLEFKKNKIVALKDCRLKKEILYKQTTENHYQTAKPDQDTLQFKSGVYIRRTPTTTQKFDRSGRLVYMSNTEGFFIKLDYSIGGDLQKIDINSEATLIVKIDRRRHHIQSLSDRKNKTITYHYENDNLVAAQSNLGSRVSYAYDDVHNLSKIEDAGGLVEQMTYNKKMDWITEVRSSGPCLDQYDWRKLAADKSSYQATTKKICSGKIVKRNKFSFKISSRENAQ